MAKLEPTLLPKTLKKGVKRVTVVDEVMNKVVLYGGLPIRYGTMIAHMDEVAKSLDPENWFKIREAGLSGWYSRELRHPTELPADVQPLTLDELKQVTEAPSGEKIPHDLWVKVVSAYPKEVRERLEAAPESSVPPGELQVIHDSRSKRSRESDEMQEHSLVVEPDDPKVAAWMKDPGRMDVRGIDTPKGKARRQAKSKRQSGRPMGGVR